MSPSVGKGFEDGMDDVSLSTSQVTLVRVGALMTYPSIDFLVVWNTYPNAIFPGGLVKQTFMVVAMLQEMDRSGASNRCLRCGGLMRKDFQGQRG
jgi:hypothetical protein